jgi:Putative zinc-finger
MGDKAMASEDVHLSDQEFLLAADGELPARRAVQVRAHLSACWDCRARMAEVEGTIADFARAHRQNLDPQLPPIDGPRALLRARLSELALDSRVGSWRLFFQFAWATRAAAFLCLLFLVAVGGKLLLQHSTFHGANSPVVPFERGSVPDHSLTPGATRRVALGDVCSMTHEDVVREVPTSLRQKVFQEYGIVNARANDYEIDFLIAPGLGGVEDIHNLWPEPYTSSMWDARVKDTLEEHLHQLVCSGKVDLSTAQNDIADNWIAAYKKYFHTDRPLSLRSRLDSATPIRFR